MYCNEFNVINVIVSLGFIYIFILRDFVCNYSKKLFIYFKCFEDLEWYGGCECKFICNDYLEGNYLYVNI